MSAVLSGEMFVLREYQKLSGVRFMQLVGKPTDEELEAYLAEERKRIARSGANTSVTVLSITEVWSSTQRNRMREFEQEFDGKIEAEQLGLAIVVPNALIRGAFTAYFWISTPKYPTKMVGTFEAAYGFVVERLREEGMNCPTEAEFQTAARAEWNSHVVTPGRGLIPMAQAS